MLFKKTNIEEKLQALHKNNSESVDILKQIQQVLEKDAQNKSRITRNLDKGIEASQNDFDFDLLETDKVYHLSQIKQICIDYRLRFLDSKYFKGEIPVEALHKLKKLEQEHQTELKGFKIIAPSKLFKLADKDDPLLLAPIGNNYYYLIHKWGNDLHPMRKMLMWPFKNIVNLILLVLAVSLLTTLLIPEGLFSKTSSSSHFWVLFFFTFKSAAAIVIFFGFAKGKNFNPAIWNSKYFNA